MTQLNLPQSNEPNVQIVNDHAETTTKDVADFFEKDHKHILEKVQNLDLPEDFTGPNFRLSEYKDSSGKMNPCYSLTRDGFIFLVMGFTGKKANLCKITYIQKFNEMEAQLLQKPQQLQLDAPSTKEDRKPLSNLVNVLVSCAPVSHRDAWHMVHARFGGKHADELTVAEIRTALEFVQSKIDLYCMNPEVDFITRKALDGTAAFAIRLTVDEAVGKRAQAVLREFKANIYITEEKPKHEIAAYIDAMTDAHNKRLQRAGIR